jgi:hypothetical protein
LMPDSSSRAPASLCGTRRPRSTLNTAAASVEESTAPQSSAVRQSRPSSQCSPTLVAPILTATATVASATPGPRAERTTDQLVVRPPSARMSTSAAMPNAWVSAVSSNSMPSPDSPISRPIPR